MRNSILILLILLFSCQKDFYLEDLKSAESQISSLNSKIQNLENSQEELLERISNLLNEKAALLENNQELSNQISQLQEDLTKFSISLEEALELLNQYEEQINALEKEKEELLESILSLLNEKAALLENNQELSNQITQLQEDLANSSISLEEALELLDEYLIKIELLEKWGPIENGEYLPVNTFLANPVIDADLIVPVVIINYIPSDNHTTITDNFAELDAVKDYGDQIKYNLPVKTVKNLWLGSDIRQKWSMEEGSRYHGQEDPSKKPYLGFKVIADIIIYSLDLNQEGQPDYFKLFNRINLKDKVETLGVKEVWFNHFPDNYWVPESNMSSPHKVFNYDGRVVADVSNSYRKDDDLPIYDRTYVVYGNAGWYANNVHNHGHQIEAQLAILDVHQNKYKLSQLFYQRFGGYPLGDTPQPYYRGGRVGLVHFPPNAEGDYDYDNTNYIESDILDWKPDGSGVKKLINKDAWHYSRTMPVHIPIIQPDEHGIWSSWTLGSSNKVGGDPHGGWLIYWMQSIPSKSNNIPYSFNGNNYTISNWWDIIYQWDETILNNRNLFE